MINVFELALPYCRNRLNPIKNNPLIPKNIHFWRKPHTKGVNILLDSYDNISQIYLNKSKDLFLVPTLDLTMVIITAAKLPYGHTLIIGTKRMKSHDKSGNTVGAFCKHLACRNDHYFTAVPYKEH